MCLDILFPRIQKVDEFVYDISQICWTLFSGCDETGVEIMVTSRRFKDLFGDNQDEATLIKHMFIGNKLFEVMMVFHVKYNEISVPERVLDSWLKKRSLWQKLDF